MNDQTDTQKTKLIELLAAGRKLEAIKLHMSDSGQTLSESKLFVESLMDEAGESAGPKVQSERSGCFSMLLMVGGLSIEMLRRIC
jgi:hypothetical protein